MQEKILVPLDGSKVGECTIPFVVDLLSKLSPEVKLEVTLLQVLRPVYPYIVGGFETPAIVFTDEEIQLNRNRANNYLEKVAETLREKGAIVNIRIEVGDASEEIAKVSEEIQADLIAMSTHGRSGLSRLAFGSVTAKVLRQRGPIPILTVRAPGKNEKQ